MPANRHWYLSAFAVLLATGACVSGRAGNFPIDAAARPATGAPAAFVFATPAADGACRNPARDPSAGTSMVLARSGGGRGDYEVPDGRYGVGAREYLRLNCATGAVIGVVKR